MIGLVRGMALELAPQRIRINSVYPTAVNIAMIFNEALYKAFRPDLDNPTLDDVTPVFETLNVLPVPWIECADVTAAVAWLASDEARYVTGVTLPADAGFALK